MCITSRAGAQNIVLHLSGSFCVNQQQEFAYAGPGTVTSWVITGAHTSTQSNPDLFVTWTQTGAVSVTCNYTLNGVSNSTGAYPYTVSGTSSPSVSISASAASICSGATVTFTASAVNAGSPIYAWYQGGTSVGGNSASYATSGLTNGQQVYCQVESSNQCASPLIATSNTITETVSPSSTVTAAVALEGSAPCPGSIESFQCTASTNTGSTPPAGYSYQWYRNGSPATGITGPPPNVIAFAAGGLNAGDQVYCKVSTTSGCYTPSVNSNTVSAVFSASETFTPTIGVPKLNYCQGETATFTAQGNYPIGSCQWTSGGVNITGATATTYTFNVASVAQLKAIGLTASTPQTGCIANPTQSTGVADAPFVVTPLPFPVPAVTITESGVITGGQPRFTFTATPANAGSLPSYTWSLNGATVGTGPTYNAGALPQGKANLILVQMTATSGICVAPSVVCQSINFEW